MSGYTERGNAVNPYRRITKTFTVPHTCDTTARVPIAIYSRVGRLQVSCDRCHERSLDQLSHCNICADGHYNLCLSCINAGDCGHPMFGRSVKNGTIVHPCSREQCYCEGPSREALETHYTESSIHDVCLKCWPRADFGSKKLLLEHWRTSPKHHRCEVCHKNLDNANNLREVSEHCFLASTSKTRHRSYHLVSGSSILATMTLVMAAHKF